MDYYWTEADYRRLFEEAGFHLLEVHYPMGKASETYSWKDEKMSSPFVVLVAEKNLTSRFKANLRSSLNPYFHANAFRLPTRLEQD